MDLHTVFRTRPISTVTPFTYRDGMTFLSELEHIKRHGKHIIDEINSIIREINLGNSETGRAFEKLKIEIAEKLDELDRQWREIIYHMERSGATFDPTDGTRIHATETVINHVYDNARVFAYEAQQLDGFNFTAEAWDALNMSARHFDLAPQHSFNDVAQSNEKPIGSL